MARSLLPDRAIVVVHGDDAEALLNRLFTNSMLDMRSGTSRYAALLSPQGKLLHDFIVHKADAEFWIDVRRDQAADLAKKLHMFKLRSKASVEDRSATLTVAATWGGALMEAPGRAFRDPRHDRLGYRLVAAPDRLAMFADETDSYRAHCIALGVPTGGVDWPYGDTFVHDANLDLLHGVDFGKGCYVGQEVVSRVHHRNSARKRVVKLAFFGTPPAPGAELHAGIAAIGHVTSTAGQEGLALVRTDRLAEAEATAAPVLAGETLVGLTLPVRSAVTAPSYADEDIF